MSYPAVFAAAKMKQQLRRREQSFVCSKTLVFVLLMSCWFTVAVDSHADELQSMLDFMRRRPGIPPQFRGYMEPEKKPPHGATMSEGRSKLNDCLSLNPFLRLEVDTDESLADVQNVTVTVSGVLAPDENDWIAVVSPSDAK